MILLTVGVGYADLSDGLIAYYPFNGNANDESGNGNHGVRYGATLTTDRYGNSDSAFSFDGVDDSIEIEDNLGFDIQHVTISVWVYVETSGSGIVFTKDNYHRGYTIAAGYNFIRFSVGDGSWHVITRESMPQEQWTHLVGTYDGERLNLYKNGENIGSAGWYGAISSGSQNLQIGMNGWYLNWGYFKGAIDDIRIYNRALSTDEINELFNYPPVANAGPDQTLEQSSVIGAEVQLDGSASSDPDGDQLSYDWTWWDEGPVSVSGPEPLVTLPPHLTIVTLTVSDGLLSDADTVQITVEDTTAPQIQIFAPEQYGLYSVGSLALEFLATDYSGISQLWGILSDASEQEQEVYTGFIPEAGVYQLVVIAIDGVDNRADSEPILFVVYDSSAGFVTGGGWIESPLGAHKVNPSLTGKATFGFVSKYKKGANEPTGNTEFQFKAGNLNFHSSSYDWLVVTGSDYARFKGTGTINGSGEYKFMLWAGDSDPDTFRIKIWLEEDETENVVYDNGMNQPIGGGSIVVHTK